MPSSYVDLGGSLRSCTLQQTMDRVRALLPLLGITRIADVTQLDCIGIPTALCIRPNAKHLSISMGKGMTFDLAFISAIMESIELFHMEHPPAISHTASYQQLKDTAPAISPDQFTAGYFIQKTITKQVFNWVDASEICSNSNVLIPHGLTQLDSTCVQTEAAYFQVSTNGIAAGNSYDEAVCHALYELIERDSLARFSQLKKEARHARQLRLDSINSALNQHYLAQYQKAGITIQIWDITSSSGIPAFQCLIYDDNPYRVSGLFRGAGCHIVKEIALARALTEAAQSRLGIITGSRDDLFLDQYQKRNIAFEQSIGTKDYSTIIQSAVPDTFSNHVEWILQRINSMGFHSVYIVNHTKKSLDIPTVQAFIPGMLFNGQRQ